MLSPDVPHPDVLVAFNAPSLTRFAADTAPGGVIVYDGSVIREPPPAPEGVRVVAVPCTDIARELGQPIVKNIVALGAVQGATRLLADEALLAAIRDALRKKKGAAAVNEEAFRRGMAAAGS